MTANKLNANDIPALVLPRFGSAESALTWFNTYPLPGFGGATAKQLVEWGRGEEVENYLLAVEPVSIAELARLSRLI